MAIVEGFYVIPYGHMDSRNYRERNVTRGALSSYLRKYPVAIKGDVPARLVYVKVSSNRSSKYVKFWRVSTDELDEVRVQRKRNFY